MALDALSGRADQQARLLQMLLEDLQRATFYNECLHDAMLRAVEAGTCQLLAAQQQGEVLRAVRRAPHQFGERQLLLNAAAKTRKELYQHKVPLLRAMVAASRREAWWMEQHDHPMATNYTGTYVVFVETIIGQIRPDIIKLNVRNHQAAVRSAKELMSPQRALRPW
jgi:hypothetical protein